MKQITFLVLLIFAGSWTTDLHAQRNRPASGPDASVYGNLSLRNLTPARTGGRITDVAVHPGNRSIWYVATASGNVWKTVNAGTTWTPIFDYHGSYSIGVVVIDQNDPNIVWLGTGENNSQRSVGYGDGVYKSLDGGKTWENMGLHTSEHIGKIIVHPENSDIVYVASQGPLWSSGGERGLYKTTDGGKSWERVLHVSENTGISELVMDPRNPEVLYAASYQRRRHFGILVAGGPEGGIFKSTDGGANWKKLSLGLPGGDLGRIALAISPQKPDVVYALIAGTDQTKGFYRSSDKGESWVKKSDYMVVDAQYYMELFPDPHQFDRVISVDMRTHVTNDGGATFERINESRKHVDSHEVIFDPNDPNYILIGCDGGIYESWDRMSTWKFHDNMPITQFYRVGLDNAAPFYNIYGGTQDNNSIGGPSQSVNRSGIRNSDWFFTLGGDGFQARIDPTDPNIVYTQYQYAGIVRYDKKSGETIDIQPQPGEGEPALRWNWDSPLIISPHNHERVYFAANKLFRSDDRGNTWEAVSDDLTKQEDRNQKEVMGRVWSVDAIFKNVFTSPLGSIVALDESPLREGLLYVGTDDGLLQISEDAGGSWTRIEDFPGVPESAYVSDVLASRHDENTVFIVFNNHKYGDYKPYILKSTNLGKSWTSIVNNIPHHEFAWTIMQDHMNENLLFVGTEFGLYFSIDGGQNWNKFRRGIPTIPIRDLEIQQREDDLVAASFGRGFYIFDDYSALREVSEDTQEKPIHLFTVKDALQYNFSNPDGYAYGHTFFTSPNPTFGAIFTYHLKESFKTKKQIRKQTEGQLIRDNKPLSYPSWEELQQEDREQRTAIVFTITDKDGNIVRRITGPTSTGVHRISWDLRHYAFRPASRGSNPSGPFVAPGTYSVSVSKIEHGEWTELSESQTFEVIPLNNTTLPAADRDALFAFQKKVGDLQRAVSSANSLITESLDELEKMKQAVINTNINDEQLIKTIHDIREKLLNLDEDLNGDVTQSSRAEFTPPAISSRVNRIAGDFYGTTSAATNTQKQSYAIAAKQFEKVVSVLNALIQQDIKRLEDRLEEEGAPYTPNRRTINWKSN